MNSSKPPLSRKLAAALVPLCVLAPSADAAYIYNNETNCVATVTSVGRYIKYYNGGLVLTEDGLYSGPDVADKWESIFIDDSGFWGGGSDAYGTYYQSYGTADSAAGVSYDCTC